MVLPYARSVRPSGILVLALLGCIHPHASRASDRLLQCVPFARALSSITLFGDAWHWWTAAAGRYERGSKPQAGSIISFRPDARMPLGHVAVVTRVISAREIEVDHADWSSPGTVTREVPVLDVSAYNDWTTVRVSLGDRRRFGAPYTTNGFIYGRPIELAPQIIHVAEALRSLSGGTPPNRSSIGWLPTVVEGGEVRIHQGAPTGSMEKGLPIVVYGNDTHPR
jgi:hypothetical protein